MPDKHPYLKKGGGKLASDHKTTTIPPETFTPSSAAKADEEWNRHVGEKFKASFEKMGLKSDGVVIEIAPGSVSKVGEGLGQMGFKGTLFVIEPEEAALKELMDAYIKLMPKATIVPLCMTLGQLLVYNQTKHCEHMPPGQDGPLAHFIETVSDTRPADCIVGNHSLDDFISGKSFADPQAMLTFFTNHYETAQAKTTSIIWERIAKDPELRMKIMDEVVKEFTEVAKLGRHMFLTAYDSFFFRRNENLHPPLRHADVMSKRVLQKIEKILIAHGCKLEGISEDETVQDPSYSRMFKSPATFFTKTDQASALPKMSTEGDTEDHQEDFSVGKESDDDLRSDHTSSKL